MTYQLNHHSPSLFSPYPWVNSSDSKKWNLCANVRHNSAWLYCWHARPLKTMLLKHSV